MDPFENKLNEGEYKQRQRAEQENRAEIEGNFTSWKFVARK
jgi:hypothetical protein